MHTEKFNLLTEYEEAQQKIKFLNVYSTKLEKLYENIKKIEYKVNSSNSSELEEFLISLRRLKTIIYATIDNFPDKLNNFFIEKDWDDIIYLFTLLSELDYETILLARETFEIIKELRNGNIENPLKRKTLELLNQYKDKRIAVVANYLDEDFLNNAKDYDYLKPNRLVKTFKLYDVVIFIGTPYLYPKFDTVFLGTTIIYLSYNIFKNHLSKIQFISNNIPEANCLYKNIDIQNKEKFLLPKYTEVAIADAERFNLNKWIDRKKKEKNYSDVNHEDLIEGQIIQLEKNKHIIVSPDSTLRIINTKTNHIERKELIIKTDKVNNLITGDWIIIKNSTEEEYLINKSKELFGFVEYESKMQLVNEYKDALYNQKVRLGSLDALLKDMKNNHVKVSSIVLLKSWLDSTIRPRNLEDILLYLGYNDYDLSKTINAAEFINSAHRHAGYELSKNIMNYLKDINMQELEESMLIEGEYSFNIKTIGVFNIESVKSVIENPIILQSKDMYKIIKTSEGI